jgi:hypothetical protein
MNTLQIIGFLVTAWSAVVLTITLGGMWHGRRHLSAHGVTGSIQLNPKARIIIWGSALGLIVGIGLIVLS